MRGGLIALRFQQCATCCQGRQHLEKRTTARDLFDAIYGLRTFLVEYDEALVQAALALLTRNHMFLVGPTGQGKSTFLTLLSDLFDGAAIFRPQLSAFTIPDHLIGPPIPSVYRREGKQLYYIDGGICDAQVALLEEFPDAGVALARALNTILLERRFVTKDQVYSVRLHSAFMTGNHVPHGEQWEAVRARQLFFFQAPKLRSISGRFSAMETVELRRSGKYPHAGIPWTDIDALAREVDGIRVSPGVLLVLAWCLNRVEERCGDTGLDDWIASCKVLTCLADLAEEVRRAGVDTFREKSHGSAVEAVL